MRKCSNKFGALSHVHYLLRGEIYVAEMRHKDATEGGAEGG